MNGWRFWFAFEARPGITKTSMRLEDRSEHWRCLAEACRGQNGVIDPDEFDRWLSCFVEHAHLWADA